MHSSTQTTLICFPHAGGGRLYYSKWNRLLSATTTFDVALYPGREQRGREPLPTDFMAVVEDSFEQLAPAVEAASFAIWGHSMGSAVGFEFVRLCTERLGVHPVGFFSSGASSPDLHRKGAEVETEAGLRKLLLGYGGIEQEHLDDPAFMSAFAPVIRADLRLFDNYEANVSTPLACPLVVLKGRDDKVDVAGWSRFTTAAVEQHDFDGGHFFIAHHAERIASLMESRIELWRQLAGADG